MNAVQEKPPEPEKKPRPVPVVSSDGLEGWERALRRDQELLKSCGLWIKEVEADGACLFRAFADQLEGDGGTTHADYRERCVDFLEANRSDFEPFLEEDFTKYCSRMREPTAWGGQVEVQALSRALAVNAVIYQPAEAGRAQSLSSTAVEIVNSEAQDSRCLQLSFHPTHHAGQHYNSVRCISDDGTGPATTASLTELRRRVDEALRPPQPAEPGAGDEQTEVASAPSAKARAKVFG